MSSTASCFHSLALSGRVGEILPPPRRRAYTRPPTDAAAETAAGTAQGATELTTDKVRDTTARLLENVSTDEEFEKRLDSLGLDEESRKVYVKEMWRWLYTGTNQQRVQASKVLGKAFVTEKVIVDAPEPLAITGFEEGIRRMLGDAADQVLGTRRDSQQESDVAESQTKPN